MLNNARSATSEAWIITAARLLARVGATAVVAASLAACEAQVPQKHAAVDTTAIRAAIDNLRSAYEQAVAAGDFEAMTALLAKDAVMVRPGGPEWDSMFRAASGAPFPAGATIDITPIEVVALSNEWAYEFGTSVTTYAPEGATDAVQLRDTYLIVLRNTGDGWKAFREVASSAPPPGGWPSQ
jgi:ketosteroid isomerase-like protein